MSAFFGREQMIVFPAVPALVADRFAHPLHRPSMRLYLAAVTVCEMVALCVHAGVQFWGGSAIVIQLLPDPVPSK